MKEGLAQIVDDVSKLIVVIESAFDGVKLGNGTGLHEAQGMDDWTDAETCAKLREKDEKDDWRKLSPDLINSPHGGLTFMDAEGFRFHLPAFLIAELRGNDRCSTVFNLTRISDPLENQFRLLTKEQCLAVRWFLFHLLAKDEYEFDRSDILRALDTIWTREN